MTGPHSPAPQPAPDPAAATAAPVARAAAMDWALCVSTYNRGRMLADCVRHALASSLPPAEIVIVDASDDWQDNRDRIAELIAASGLDCPLQYAPARRKSLTVQRNQCVALARAAILFMIDDDAMLHPGTAARIMGFYRDDTEGRIAAISCRNAPLPVAPDTHDARKQTNRAGNLVQNRPAPVQRGIDFALRHVLMIPAEQRFVTYDRPELRWQGDTTLPEGLWPMPFINGFALTLRRAVALREPFDEGLVGSCMAEDLDASYRIGRHGLLAIAPDAHIDHLEAAAARSKRRTSTALCLLNVAYFVRRNSDRQTRDLARYALWYLRMLAAEFPKDLAGRRWDLPQVRGALLAGRALPALLRVPRAELPARYQGFQTWLMTGLRPGPSPDNMTTPDHGANG
ncbi:glycosyltransferase family 2 protein [Paracoccus lutimaris]|uniref:Glycosyl transferase family 2 n=1 Tax=Paracoccus lutimaris TaxID=1490030 RepID=A0A368YKQ7_9RHOB|nr:glycosyltransferase family 2 protein [Paracoccus lutimaris]RCW80810.1 glycosyl transferase family 2 [Paracoccus lutimaris]